MCPNGVEYKTLGEVCQLKRGHGLSKNDIVPASADTLPIILYGELYTTYSGHIKAIKSSAIKEKAKLGVVAKKEIYCCLYHLQPKKLKLDVQQI